VHKLKPMSKPPLAPKGLDKWCSVTFLSSTYSLNSRSACIAKTSEDILREKSCTYTKFTDGGDSSTKISSLDNTGTHVHMDANKESEMHTPLSQLVCFIVWSDHITHDQVFIILYK